MAEELTDEEVFGSGSFGKTLPELSDEEVFGNLAPPAATKEEQLFQRIQSGERMGPNVPAMRNLGVSLGASVAVPELLVSAFPGLAPATATGIFGYLGRLGLLNTAGATAGAVTAHAPEVLAGRETGEEAFKRSAIESGIGALAGTAAGPLLQKGVQGISGGLREMFAAPVSSAGQAASRFQKGFGIGLIRPLFESTADAEAQAAARFIEQATGMKPAKSMGEALGKTFPRGRSYLEIENELGEKATGALSADARNDITRAILFQAANLAGESPTPSQLAQSTLSGIQEAIGTQISGPVRKAVSEIANDISSSLTTAAKSTAGEAMQLTAPVSRATGYEAGNIGKMLTEDATRLFQSKEDELYANYRTLLGQNPPSASLSNSAREARSILGSGLKTTDPETGQVSTIARSVPDSPARKFIEEIEQAASTPQDIETLRRFRTQVGESIKNEGVFAGLSDANKKRLYGALSRDIDEAIAKIPNKDVREALKTANAFRRDNIDLFQSGMAESAAGDVLEGGKTGQGLLNNVLGDTDRYKAFQSILGNNFGTFRTSARDYVLTRAQTAASEPGKSFSVGKALESIEKLPKEIADDLFPGTSSRLRELAAKEIKVSGLQKALPSDPDKALEWVTANKAELDEFLGPGGEQKFLDAMKLKAAEKVRFHNAVLRDVAAGKADSIAADPVGFIDSLMDGTYSRVGDVGEALRAASSYQPHVLEQLQREYLSRLIGDSTIDGVISGEMLASKLAKPISGKAPVSAGAKLDISNEILGKAKVDSLRSIAENIGKTQKELLGGSLKQQKNLLEFLANAETPMDAAFLIGSKAGLARSGARAAVRLANKSASWKYQFAARLANDPETLAILSKPVENLNGAEASLILNAFLQQEVSEMNR